MSRSQRQTPIVPRTNSETEKDEKRIAHQRERKWLHDHLNVQTASVEDFELTAPPQHPRAGQVEFGKDGKEFIGHRAVYEDPRQLRK